MLRRAVVPFVRAIRNAHDAPVKFTGQTPTSFVHAGWANSRTPFHVHNKYLFGAKAILIFMIPFWAPWIVVTYQMKKANEQLTLQKFFE
ncbi:hypothetical protein Y032_0234g3131 [Ancylostoma ceylanicum]|uniref:Uncharacterized protein n=1 Tax=Ancylostoma ceylanicum TaxID=53326 RepID=A0A016SF50_9BILA|nr:hypothetical protein Y032_0234g3131 [Ancylostoma ceylanicum]